MRGANGLITWIPSFSFHLNELDRQQVLVDLDDLWDDDGHGKVLLDQVFVQVQGRLDELLTIIPMVPDVKFAIESISFLRVFLLLEFKQRLTILQTERMKLLL